MKLSGYKSSQPSSLLKEGRHLVSLLSYLECTSRDDVRYRDGKLVIAGLKEKEFPWTNGADQVAALFGNKEGSITNRYQMFGAGRYSELSDKDLQSGKYFDKEGFACTVKTVKGKEVYTRLEDPERTAKALKMLDRFIWSFVPRDEERDEDGEVEATKVLDRAIAEKTLVYITVINEPWQDEDQYRVSKIEAYDPASVVPMS